MDHQQDRKIDFQVASLDGGLFPTSMRPDSSPLIEIGAAPPERVCEPASPPVTRQHVLTLAEPVAAPVSRQPISDFPPPAHSISVAPPAPKSPRRGRLLTAAGLAGGMALTALCAMAFQGSLPGAARSDVVAAQAASPSSEGQPRAAMLADVPDVDTFTDTGTSDARPLTAVVDMPEATAPELWAPVVASEPEAAPALRAQRAVARMPALPTEAQAPSSNLAELGALPRDIDRSGAALTIALAGGAASDCAEPGDPHTSMPVSVTFAPSGHVTSAHLDGGPFLGTSTGSCIARALRSVSVRPFDGTPVTVHGSLQMR